MSIIYLLYLLDIGNHKCRVFLFNTKTKKGQWGVGEYCLKNDYDVCRLIEGIKVFQAKVGYTYKLEDKLIYVTINMKGIRQKYNCVKWTIVKQVWNNGQQTSLNIN